MELYNDDCFNIFPNIKDKSINLFLLDLPYANKTFGNCTACKWDSPIDLDRMWIEIKRMMKPNGIIVFFCNVKFGYTLIQSNEKWFKYDLIAEKIWKKSRKVGFLSANKQPLRQHENIYIFNEKPVTHSKNEDQEYSTYNPQKTEGKPYKVKGGKSKSVDGSLSRGHEVISKEYENKGDRHPTSIIEHENLYVFNGNNDENEDLMNYSKKVLKHIGKTKSIIKKEIPMADHFFRYSRGNFSLPIKETYDELIKHYKINEMEEFIPFHELETTYNPQKTEGKPYKCKQGKQTDLYGIEEKEKVTTDNKGDRHPTSIIEHENLYVFDNPVNEAYNDLELTRNIELRDYAKKVYKFIGKTKKEIIKKMGQKIEHFLGFTNSQFALPIKETYDELIKHYKINDMEGFLDYDILKGLWEDSPPKVESTYNPQKTEGKPYKVNGRKSLGYYGENSNFNSSYLEDRKTDNKGDRHPTSIIEHENLYVFKKEQGTYNPQKTEGKPYNKIMTGNNNKQKIIYGECLNGEIHQKGNRVINKGDRHPTSIIEQDLGEIDGGYYRGENGKPFKRMPPNKEGIRHPTSIIDQEIENTILEYNNPAKSLHRTQKPVELCEWLIKTYTNEDDVVMDFTMGSGTVGIACSNTNRDFIGIEMDKEIFKIAENRILKHVSSN